ncbi:MAG TPA: galactose oxidase-like domain-containing protein [Terriglobia bacterium]|nr:galactose oxidase-like domain-containing protein [Terriglobia bacterium]
MIDGRILSQRGWRRLSVVATAVFLALLPAGLLPRHTRSSPATAFAKTMLVNKKPATPANIGQWTAPHSMNAIAIHMALLYTGKVLMWYSDLSVGANTGSVAVLYDPIAQTFTQENVPFPYDVFCAGIVELPSGRVMTFGGLNDSYGAGSDAGIAQTLQYIPYSNTWTESKPMSYQRWYPSAVELPNGNVIVASGENYNATRLVLQMEEYNTTNNTWSTLPYTANISNTANFYPKLILLPSGNIFMAGMVQSNQMFNPATNTWSASPANPSVWTRIYGGHVLLPGLERVLAVGGRQESAESGSATNSISWIDFSQPTPVWVDGCGSLGSANPAGCIPESQGGPQAMDAIRENPELVLLPDGTVMTEGGGQGGGKYSNPVYYPDDFNPVTNTWASRTTGAWAGQQVQRTYHSTAVLLPDGRVISAGSDWGSNPKSLEIFSPPYLETGGTRPTITSAPSTLNYGQQFTITTPNAATITRVALLKVESCTHTVRFDARFVDLSFSIGNGQITATAPASGNYAPPGYYMLDILNSSGVPAVMPFVLVQ